MPNPLLDVATLKFRPFEDGMKGWFVWRNDSDSRGVEMVLVLDKHTMLMEFQHEQWPLTYSPTIVAGEFAGPIL